MSKAMVYTSPGGHTCIVYKEEGDPAYFLTLEDGHETFITEKNENVPTFGSIIEFENEKEANKCAKQNELCKQHGYKVREVPNWVHCITMATPELQDECIRAIEFHNLWKAVPSYDVVQAAIKYLNCHMVIPTEVQSILKRIAKMEDVKNVQAGLAAAKKEAQAPSKVVVTKAAKAPAAKAPAAKAPAAKAPAAKAKAKAPRKAKYEATAVIKLLKGHETKKFQEGSVRQQVFKKITDGLTVGALVKSCAKFADEKAVLYNLAILSDPTQKHQATTVK